MLPSRLPEDAVAMSTLTNSAHYPAQHIAQKACTCSEILPFKAHNTDISHIERGVRETNYN